MIKFDNLTLPPALRAEAYHSIVNYGTCRSYHIHLRTRTGVRSVLHYCHPNKARWQARFHFKILHEKVFHIKTKAYDAFDEAASLPWD